jgi:hypothetical protein
MKITLQLEVTCGSRETLNKEAIRPRSFSD